jgi:glycosyltransferase involved in cell wall biosynthesis
MNIVLATDVLHRGGAELFTLRLAHALKSQGHKVSLFILVQDQVDESLRARYAPDISVATPNIRARWLWSKIDSVLFKLGIDFSFLRFFYGRSLLSHMRSNHTEIVHTHLFTADIVAAKIVRKTRAVAVTTIHGDYLDYSRSVDALKRSRILNFDKKLGEVIATYSSVVAITEEQRSLLEPLMRKGCSASLHKVYNGFSPARAGQRITRGNLGIPKDAFVVGMVARGIRNKGWQELIAAFESAKLPNSYLILVGDGEFLQSLRKTKCRTDIIFTGQVDNVLDYVDMFDIACLPTLADNLPTVIIEYLFCGKPVVATRQGEIPLMLGETTPHTCGHVIELGDFNQVSESVRDAIINLYREPELRRRLASNTKQAMRAFSMAACIEAYEAIYLGAHSRARARSDTP